MPVYEYTALDRAGKNIAGIIDADSTVAARQKLRASGKYPVQVKETAAKEKTEAAVDFSLPSLFNRVNPDDVHALTRQLEYSMADHEISAPGDGAFVRIDDLR